ncbi:MAG: hypothetical protein WCE51_06435 [Chthoniobacterales bacterium]|jgi:hypothetical protein
MKSTDKGFRLRRRTDDPGPGPRYWRHRLPKKNNQAEAIGLNGESRAMDLPRPPYKNPCGLGLIKKAGLPASIHNDAGSMRRP